ncbi:DUF6428 family protein [Deinococcus peraridilitoris]|uniref:Uncharacterized protein n=1 Tax=Deinococcus peraridilitoris (strain DSM 19664 / LMG 22246 / CIP 109416 / KR-200) TaxID=937777 RepID=L0A0F0_DEIPD|nr:DUF6428 family protein [Deinococcus peraridilitoris]AFZ67321.1 hypothetical protein Deipe_1804 [Deinococcus peraridilitoris DSM 19664]
MTQTLTTPNRTQAFLDTLAPHAGKALILQLHGEVLVPTGYHVTEVKAVTIEAMDCAGRAAAWRETVIQLWNGGGEEDRGFMTVDKFLGIYGRVAKRVPVQADSVLRFEYGDTVHPTIQYLVTSIEVQSERVLVNLGYPGVSCKPNDERLAAGQSACGGPRSGSVEPVTLENIAVQKSKGSCCG